MHADLKGALEQLSNSYHAFEHNGKSMSKDQVRFVLQKGIELGYETTKDFKEGEVDNILQDFNKLK